MAKVIAITNQKGGVGKTTTCSALCGGLAELGNKVLAIDLDPQGNLSFSLGVEVEDNFTIYDVMKGNCDIADAIVSGETCDVVPSNILLSGLELEMTGVGREYVLREQINEISKRYDYIILDLSESIQGTFEILCMCDRIYTIIREDERARAKLAQYEELLRAYEYEEVLEKTRKELLPQFEHLPERIEQYTVGELARYIRKLIREDLGAA